MKIRQREARMAKELNCGDIMTGCEHRIRAETEAELLRKAAEHARERHGIEEVDEQTAELLRSRIREA
jgi:predicted small metal-binding protein